MRELGEVTSFDLMPALIDVIVPSFEQSAETLKNVFLVMEFGEIDLRTALKNGVLAGISQDHVKLMLFNLLCTVKVMHSANVVHRDLKPSNLIINKNSQIKICDYGMARTLPESLIGKGSGNTRRLRANINQESVKSKNDSATIKRMIAKKLNK